LKAYFNESAILYDPNAPDDDDFNVAMVPNEDGSELVPYNGPDILTLGGEINKLASNIAYGRQPAGVHYRSDSEDGLEFGEYVAMEYLLELVRDHPEPNAKFEFTKRNGDFVSISQDVIEVTPALVNTSSDDALSVGEWVGIGIAIGVVVVVALFGVSRMTKQDSGSNAQDSYKQNLMDNDSQRVN